MILAVALLGCGTTPTPPTEATPVVEPAPAKPVVSKPFPVVQAGEPGAPVAPGGPVPIELQFEGVGDLHQRYFGDREIVTQLAIDLGACMNERAVLKISYDTERRIGRIRVYVDPKNLACTPRRTPQGVDLSPLRPIGEGLARYRDTLAGRFDYRLASFRIDLEALSGTHLCRLDLAGQFPPDGSTWGACAVLGGEEVCAGEKTDGVSVLGFDDPKRTAYLASCFAG